MRLKIAEIFLIAMSLLFSTVSRADEGSAFVPELVLKNDFAEYKYWPERQVRLGSNKIEFCGGDWCQLVVARNKHSMAAAWEAVFTMFYFYDANKEYVSRRAGLAQSILAKYSERCADAVTSDDKASCVLSQLQAAHHLEYWRVQYDVSHRCVSGFSSKPPHFTGRGKCKPIR